MKPHLALFALVTALAALPTAFLTAQGPTWSSPNVLPPGRANHAMAFDQGRGRAVLFGGRDLAGTRFGDTWEWDGAAWIQRTPAHSPSPRKGCGMTYDPVRGVTVLFGGDTAGGDQQDTWEWDGDDWTQRSPAVSPQPRSDHAMTCHGGPNPGVLVHGGTAGTSTWLWNGGTWTLQSNTGPTSVGCGMAYASSTQCTYLLVDTTTITSASPCWRWDGSTWAIASSNALSNTTVVYDPDRDQLIAAAGVLFNGVFSANNALVQASMLLSPSLVTWGNNGSIFPIGPLAIRGATSVYDTTRRAVLTFGGLEYYFGAQAMSNVLTEAPSTTGAWSRRHPSITTSPAQRTLTEMAFDGTSGRALLFGGWDGTQVLADAWTFDGRNWTNHGNAGVPARIQPALCYVPAWGATVLFGGGDFGTTFYNDTMLWGSGGFLPTIGTGAPPPARRDHDMVCDTARSRIVMYGGYDGGYLSDTWELQSGPLGLQWQQISPFGSPGPRNGHRMAYDQRRQRVVMFGGGNQGIFDGTTWEYTAGNSFTPAVWTQMSPVQSPPARWAHTMEYDPARGVVVMTGGYGDPLCGNYCASYLNDVWEYDGTTWTQRFPEAQPPVRESAASCYDTLRQRIVLQGGSDFSLLSGETWLYNAPVDRFGEGMLGGSSLELRCVKFPVAGRPVRFAFANPSGLGWITIFPAPAPGPGLTLGPGLLCSTGTFYGVPAIVADAMGDPGAVEFTLPFAMAGLGFVAQGISLDLALCLKLTDPLAVTVHAP